MRMSQRIISVIANVPSSFNLWMRLLRTKADQMKSEVFTHLPAKKKIVSYKQVELLVL